MLKSQAETFPIDRAISRSMRQSRGLRFSHHCKDQTFEPNKLFIIWPFALFLQACNRLVGSGRIIGARISQSEYVLYQLKILARYLVFERN